MQQPRSSNHFATKDEQDNCGRINALTAVTVCRLLLPLVPKSMQCRELTRSADGDEQCEGNQSLRRQPLHLGNDRFFASFCIVFTAETRVVFGQHLLKK